MTTTLSKIVLLMAAILGFSSVSFAKGTTTKLVITGPGLSVPLETAIPAATRVGVWAGDFIDGSKGSVSGPVKSEKHYQIHFFVTPPRTQEVRLMYTVYYVRDIQSGDAFIYLPGNGDVWHDLNSSTISRPDHEGKWYYANPVWSRTIASVLSNSITGD